MKTKNVSQSRYDCQKLARWEGEIRLEARQVGSLSPRSQEQCTLVSSKESISSDLPAGLLFEASVTAATEDQGEEAGRDTGNRGSGPGRNRCVSRADVSDGNRLPGIASFGCEH
ncbi:hypothetical protein PoB_003036900 [Plakobranchus ocellatus]|uniref:Uncharacterized protein n=1 Tax=Plakobranchus ocellatus TaxID=259542 RepID=A0AAV4ABQ6_9GAST|nr:hypothetical protein PoB_003036900 [Plakobranchus ocellatus]